MSLDLTLDPYSAAEWAEADCAAHPPLGDVQLLPFSELAGLCEQAFLELDSVSPAVGSLERYEQLVDEVERRQLAGFCPQAVTAR